jgi:hypothetical protein
MMRVSLWAALTAASIIMGVGRAYAVPAFAVQTGQPCTACHVGGFGPQLTPFGRQFKLEGYTARSSDTFTAPVSAMAVASYLQTAKDQAAAPAPGFATNNNIAFDQASIFLGGGYGDHFGGLSQFTYDGVARAFAWDNLDLRAVNDTTINGHDVLFGLSLNNNPGLEDAWNTLPDWGFPYTGSALAPAPAAGTIMSGALAQTVLGLSAYAWWNTSIYTEAGLYTTPSHGFLRAVGADSSGPGSLAAPAPYLRAAYQKDYYDQNFEVGVFGFFPTIHPGNDNSTGKSDHYRDIGIDASYQFMGTGANIYQLNAIYTNERQTLDESTLLGASNPSNTLNDFRFDASYYWQNEIGGTVQFFNTWGSADSLLYAGNSTFKPNSSGFVFQTDYTPFGGTDAPLGGRFSLRVGLQYFLFTRFNGATSNYDGLSHNASDNNAFRLFTWFAL